MKQATTIEEQIALLKNRGMFIGDEEKAKEILMDIGYYRLGFYWFPFEKTYPAKDRTRSHVFIEGTCELLSYTTFPMHTKAIPFGLQIHQYSIMTL